MADLKTNGIFCGKTLGKSGNKKDGTPFQSFKLAFKPSETSDKQFSFTTFKADLDLKMGQWYNVTYYEKPNTDPSRKPFKTLISATEGKGEVVQADTAAPVVSGGINMEKFDDFKAAYSKAVTAKGTTPDMVHMIGSYLCSTNKELVSTLAQKCQQAVDEMKKK
jgi:hypothetical protein